MVRALTARLSAMMFLQFFVWGAWYTTIGVYMSQNGMEASTAWPYMANAIAAIAAPFFLGLIADRFFATEKVIAVLHLLGGIVMLVVPQTTGTPPVFMALLLVYNLCYMPTLGLANSLAFHHIQDQEKQFPFIRVFGTIGWIAAGNFISFALGLFVAAEAEKTALPLYLTGVSSILLGVYAFSLPHTPPPGRGQKVSIRSIAGLDAFRQLGSKPFYIFAISSLLICIPLAVYYAFTQIYLAAADVRNIAATQTLGQASEIIFMLLMPMFFVRLGVKWMLVSGMAAWALRYVLFAAAAPGAIFWMIALGILLHGICYDFFFVTGQIYVDKKSTPAIRGQAQGFLVLITYGVGMLIGSTVGQALYNKFLTPGAQVLTLDQFAQYWWYPAAFAAAVMVFFALTFRDRVVAADRISEGTVAAAATREEGV